VHLYTHFGMYMSIFHNHKRIRQHLKDLKAWINKTFYPIYNNFLKFVLRYRFFTIFSIFVLFILLFQLGPKPFIDFQNDLNSIVIELIGALIIVFFIDYFVFRLTNRSSYPETKSFCYSILTGTLSNISLDILLNYIRVVDIEDNKIFRTIMPDKNTIEEGVKLLEYYTKEENRRHIESLYINLSEEQILCWKNRSQEQLDKLNFYISSTHLIHPKDSDLADILRLKHKLELLNEELRKTKLTRERNKMFFSSYIMSICNSLIRTINSGLYYYLCIPEIVESVMRRTEE